MKRDQIDILLQLAYLEGRVRTHGAYEKSVARKKQSRLASTSSRVALQQRLETALTAAELGELPSDLLLTVGAFLKKVRSEQSLRREEIFSRLNLTHNIYRMLEEDRISPLKISVASWNRLRQFFDLSVNALVEMVRRTHQLVFFRPSFRTTLARYDTRKGKGPKASTLEQAAAELYTKAKLSLPREEEAKLNALLDSIKQGV
jgi:transcriptional regulator with XRE-family HTH domain